MRCKPTLLLQCCAAAGRHLSTMAACSLRVSDWLRPNHVGSGLHAHFSDCLQFPSAQEFHDDWHHPAVWNGSVGQLPIDSFASLVGLNQDAPRMCHHPYVWSAVETMHMSMWVVGLRALHAISLSPIGIGLRHFALCTLFGFACELLPCICHGSEVNVCQPLRSSGVPHILWEGEGREVHTGPLSQVDWPRLQWSHSFAPRELTVPWSSVVLRLSIGLSH